MSVQQGLQDGPAPQGAYQLAPQLRAGLGFVSGLQRPGEFIEGIVQRATVQEGKVAGGRSVGNAAGA